MESKHNKSYNVPKIVGWNFTIKEITNGIYDCMASSSDGKTFSIKGIMECEIKYSLSELEYKIKHLHIRN
jgi:hypothetical protein